MKDVDEGLTCWGSVFETWLIERETLGRRVRRRGGREALDLDRVQWKEPKPQNLLCERIKEGVDALMTST